VHVGSCDAGVGGADAPRDAPPAYHPQDANFLILRDAPPAARLLDRGARDPFRRRWRTGARRWNVACYIGPHG
jgi:hypothetical protein